MRSDNPNTRGSERNATPLQHILLHPEKFDPDKLAVNELEQPNGVIFAKIPQIPNRIARRKKANSDTYYIELILSSHYDPETQQNRNKKVIIGEDISYYLKGMMVINDNYHEYFNKNGSLLPHIQAMMLEENRQKRQAKAEANRQSTNDTEQPTRTDETEQPAKHAATQPETSGQADSRKPEVNQQQKAAAPTPKQKTTQLSPEEERAAAEKGAAEEGEATEVQIRELKERQQALDQKEQELIQTAKDLNELRKELESQQMILLIRKEQAIKDHIDLLEDILMRYEETIEAQAKRKPDTPMRPKQIRTINELLLEIQSLFAGSEVDDFLHLAEEPDEKTDTPGTTYGEMALLLNTYRGMLHHFDIGKLRYK